MQKLWSLRQPLLGFWPTGLRRKIEISAGADGGPHFRICARKTLRSAPHGHHRKFSGARSCRVTFKHLPQPLRSHIRSFGTLGQLLQFSKKNIKKPKNAPGGQGGGLLSFLGVNISFFVRITPLWSFRTLNWPPSNIFKKKLKKPKNHPPGGGSQNLFFFPEIFF